MPNNSFKQKRLPIKFLAFEVQRRFEPDPTSQNEPMGISLNYFGEPVCMWLGINKYRVLKLEHFADLLFVYRLLYCPQAYIHLFPQTLSNSRVRECYLFRLFDVLEMHHARQNAGYDYF